MKDAYIVLGVLVALAGVDMLKVSNTGAALGVQILGAMISAGIFGGAAIILHEAFRPEPKGGD